MKYVECQKLNYVEYNLQVFAYCTIPQLLYNYDAFILGSITIAYIGLIMTMHDIVFSMNIAGGDAYVVVQGVYCDAPL